MTTTPLFKGTYTNEVIRVLEALEQGFYDVELLNSFTDFAKQFNDEEFNNYAKQQWDIMIAYCNDEIERSEAFKKLADMYITDEQYIRVLGKTALYTQLYLESLPDEDDEDEQ